MNMNLNNVNKKNTREWCKFNENSQGKRNREQHTKQFGGSWKCLDKKNDYWEWLPLLNVIVNFETPKKERVMFKFTHKTGTINITDNFTKFCRDNNINSSAMHDVLSGKRKQFKGYVVERIPPQDNRKIT